MKIEEVRRGAVGEAYGCMGGLGVGGRGAGASCGGFSEMNMATRVNGRGAVLRAAYVGMVGGMGVVGVGGVAAAQETVVFDTIGPRPDAITSQAGSIFSPQARIAFPFSPSASGNLTSVAAVLSLAGPAFEVPSNLRWEVWTQATTDGPPVTLLGTFAAAPLPIIPLTPTPWLLATTSQADGSIPLQAGGLYMLTLARDGGAQVAWWSNGEQARPYVMPYATGAWLPASVFRQAQIRVSIPAAPVGGVIVVAAGAAWMRRRRGV